MLPCTFSKSKHTLSRVLVVIIVSTFNVDAQSTTCLPFLSVNGITSYVVFLLQSRSWSKIRYCI